jgi:hypothetical protein
LYEAQNKAKKYVRKRELSGWKDVAMWKDFKPPYLLEAI